MMVVGEDDVAVGVGDRGVGDETIAVDSGVASGMFAGGGVGRGETAVNNMVTTGCGRTVAVVVAAAAVGAGSGAVVQAVHRVMVKVTAVKTSCLIKSLPAMRSLFPPFPGRRARAGLLPFSNFLKVFIITIPFIVTASLPVPLDFCPNWPKVTQYVPYRHLPHYRRYWWSTYNPE
ncbi:MAG: hypothetical protein BroJett015_00210 [Chloroflexota bacterium]|nr:MAG: hypothetical protein BroJett015_00210 [Chloroflexota bacterium]